MSVINGINGCSKIKLEYKILYNKSIEIETEEPPTLRVLDSICFNEMIRAYEYDESEYVDIKWYQKALCYWLDINPGSLLKRKLQTQAF